MVTAQHTLEKIASSEEGKVIFCYEYILGWDYNEKCGLTEKYNQERKKAKFADNLIGH